MNFENTPIEWNVEGNEPSEDLKTNGFLTGHKLAANTLNWIVNFAIKAIKEIQEKLSSVNDVLGSHTHSISDVTNLQTTLNSKASSTHTHSQYAPLVSPAFTGTPEAPTAADGTTTTQIATTAFVAAAIAKIDTKLKFAPITSLTADIATGISQESPMVYASINAVNAQALIGNIPEIIFSSTEVYATGLNELFLYCTIDNDTLRVAITQYESTVPAGAISTSVSEGTVVLL